MEVRLPIEDRHHARPIRLDVPGRTPKMPDRSSPLPWPRSTPLADRKDDGPSRRVHRHGPLRVERARAHAAGVAPVDLQIIDSPLGESPRISELVAETRRQAHARIRSGVGIDAEAEAECVHAVGHRGDAPRETRGIGDEVAVAVPLWRHPAIVDDDVAIPGVAHPTRDHRLGALDHQPLIDVSLEPVPTVPAHRRGRCESIGESAETHQGTTATRSPAP